MEAEQAEEVQGDGNGVAVTVIASAAEQLGGDDDSQNVMLATMKEEVPSDGEGDADVEGAEFNNAVAMEKEEGVQFDTTEEFGEVFGSKNEYDSWEEFSNCLTAFQTKTGTSFKPRSACSIDYANERRINGPIPERFVYSNVKMICAHFGAAVKRGAGQKRNYVGKGCGAFMNVSFNKGALRITQSHHVHTNHEREIEQSLPSFRVFNFTEELDLIMLREVNRVNPFKFTNGEKQWVKAVDRLKDHDERFSAITPRLVKKRIRFLVDKFVALTHGRRPPAEDEMGNILYELNRAKKDTMDALVSQGPKKKRRGRPPKRPLSDDDDFFDDDDVSDAPTGPPSKKPAMAASSSSQSSVSKNDITVLLSYLKSKDEEERRIRQRELEEDRRLRQREMDLRKEELSYQKERFEFEKAERRAHLDLLKAQLQAFEHNMVAKQAIAVAPKDGNQVTEYTIVVDGNNQVLETLPNVSLG